MKLHTPVTMPTTSVRLNPTFLHIVCYYRFSDLLLLILRSVSKLAWPSAMMLMCFCCAAVFRISDQRFGPSSRTEASVDLIYHHTPSTQLLPTSLWGETFTTM